MLQKVMETLKAVSKYAKIKQIGVYK